MIWKKIDGWPYEISRCGVVRSLPRNFITEKNREMDYEGGKIMAHHKRKNTAGYYVKLHLNTKYKFFPVRKLLSQCYGAGVAAEYVINNPA